VIHAGMYYPTGSLRAIPLLRAAARLLYGLLRPGTACRTASAAS